ncbi:MAG TPA: hypothetical protein DCQ52_02530, partial [Acidimicrobiaceae bacterium]|nr:hypothetical protein [Acidimicrobiaceae bacterium]
MPLEHRSAIEERDNDVVGVDDVGRSGAGHDVAEAARGHPCSLAERPNAGHRQPREAGERPTCEQFVLSTTDRGACATTDGVAELPVRPRPSLPTNGVALTDLLAGRVSDDSVKGGVRTRVVLDTSVLVGDPGCLHGFAGVDVVIPFTVIEELDSLKTRPDDVGRAARTALRTIEELRVKAGGSLATPVTIGDPAAEGTLQVEINGIQKHLLLEHGLDPNVPDNRIIGAALGQAMHAPTRMV